jgi:solute:Na+ symporter, SSS family
MNFQLQSADILVIIAYLVVSIALGLYVGQKKEDGESYFLAGRSLSWPLIGFSLFASNMSGSSFIGLAGEGYARGIAVYNYEWIAVVVLVFFVFFIIPIYLNSRIYTIPEYLERRFDVRLRKLFSLFTIIANIFIDAAAGLYAGGIVIQMLYPEVSLWVPVLVLGIMAGLYTVAGGLAAVVVTDTIQAIVLILGSLVVSIMAFSSIESWSQLYEIAPENGMHLVLPASDPFLPWPGLFTGVLIIGFYFWINNQFIVQRVLGARDIRHARYGALFAGFLKLPVLFLMVLPGTVALFLFPDLSSPDLAFPSLVFSLLPEGVRGFVIAALVAAIMSSIDSTLNSASTLVTMDFIAPRGAGYTQKQIVTIGRVVTLVFTVVAVLWAPQIIRFDTLWQYLQSVLAYITPPIVVIFVSGFFFRGATARGAFATFVWGVPLGLLGFVGNEIFEVLALHYLYACGVLFLISSGIMWIVSAVFPESEGRDMSLYIWHKGMCANEVKTDTWYSDYRVLSFALLMLAGVVVVVFF